MQLKASLLMKLHVTLGEVQFVGGMTGRELCIIPITGGRFEGPLLRGRVCPGGADWNTKISNERMRESKRFRALRLAAKPLMLFCFRGYTLGSWQRAMSQTVWISSYISWRDTL